MWVHLRQRFLDLQHGGESLALPALLLRAHRPGVGAGRWPWKKGSQHGEERICRGGIELRSQRHAPPSSAGCEAVRAAPHLALAQALRLHAVRCAGVSPAHHRQRSARAGGGQEDGALRPLRPLLSIPGKGAGLGAPRTPPNRRGRQPRGPSPADGLPRRTTAARCAARAQAGRRAGAQWAGRGTRTAQVGPAAALQCGERQPQRPRTDPRVRSAAAPCQSRQPTCRRRLQAEVPAARLRAAGCRTKSRRRCCCCCCSGAARRRS